MNPVELVIGLILVAAVLATVAQNLRLPYPTVLVLGGLALGFVPGLPHVQIPPEITFLVFIPPLVYLVSTQFGLRDLRKNLWPIFRLSVGLVLLNLVCVASAVHWGIEGFTWSTAFVLAAIVTPTDTVAVTAVTSRLPVPKRVSMILEGESLFNDVVALVAYQQAVKAVVTGSFSIFATFWILVWEAIGGIAVGLVVGVLATWSRHRLRDPAINTAASLMTPFAAYLGAEALGASGILATVATGLFVGHILLSTLRPLERLQTLSFWTGLQFILEGLAFVLIGFQLRLVMANLSRLSTAELIGDCILVCVMTLVVRLIWMFAWHFVPKYFAKRKGRPVSSPPWQHAVLIAWSGMRGIDSLAAALALPMLLADQTTPFPQRDLILFLSFSVILTTLVVHGLTLPVLIRRLKLLPEDDLRRDEAQIRIATAEAAIRRLKELEQANGLPTATVGPIRATYLLRIEHDRSRLDQLEQGRAGQVIPPPSDIMLDLLKSERQVVRALRAAGKYNDDALKSVERSLDYQELKLATE